MFGCFSVFLAEVPFIVAAEKQGENCMFFPERIADGREKGDGPLTYRGARAKLQRHDPLGFSRFFSPSFSVIQRRASSGTGNNEASGLLPVSPATFRKISTILNGLTEREADAPCMKEAHGLALCL
jgi:hypothetical protein